MKILWIKSFIEKALKDKKYYDVIDNDSIDLDHQKKEFKTLNSIKNNTKTILKLRINNNTNNMNNINNLDESVHSSEMDEVSSV